MGYSFQCEVKSKQASRAVRPMAGRLYGASSKERGVAGVMRPDAVLVCHSGGALVVLWGRPCGALVAPLWCSGGALVALRAAPREALFWHRLLSYSWEMRTNFEGSKKKKEFSDQDKITKKDYSFRALRCLKIQVSFLNWSFSFGLGYVWLIIIGTAFSTQ